MNNYFGAVNGSTTLSPSVIAKINAITPSAWNNLSLLDQGLAKTSSPTFYDLSLTNKLNLKNGSYALSMKAPVLNANHTITWPDADITLPNQSLDTTSTPQFAKIGINKVAGTNAFEVSGNVDIYNGTLITNSDSQCIFLRQPSANKYRWAFELRDADPNDGSNTGSNLLFRGYNDAETTSIEPFKINRKNGYVGINLPSSYTPIYQLQTKGIGQFYTEGAGASSAILALERHSNDGQGAFISFIRSGGSFSAPAAIASGNTLWGILGTAYTSGVDTQSVSSITATCTAFSGGNITSDIRFHTINAGVVGEKLRIQGDGKVGMGTTAPEQALHVVGNIQATGTDTSVDRGILVKQYSEDGLGALVNCYKYRGTPSSVATIQNGDYLGGIRSYAYTNSIKSGSSILFQCNGMVGTNPTTTIEFISSYNGTTTKHMYLTGDGNLWINNLATDGPVYSVGKYLTNTAPPSDKKWKTNIIDLGSALDKLMKLKVVSFKWKDEVKKDANDIGFIANDVQPILPDLVSETYTCIPDGQEEVVNVDGKKSKQTKYKKEYGLGMRQEKLIPYLVKSIQELADRISVLEKRPSAIAALEARRNSQSKLNAKK